MKYIICILVQLNILCLICINRQYPKLHWICQWRVSFAQFTFEILYNKDDLQHRWLVQTKPNIIIRSTSVCRTTAGGGGHLLQSVMVSVAVSKVAETDLVFVVQSDAKINSVILWERTLKMSTLKINSILKLIPLKVYSSELFLFQLTNDLCTCFTKIVIILFLSKAVFKKRTLLFQC